MYRVGDIYWLNGEVSAIFGHAVVRGSRAWEFSYTDQDLCHFYS